MSLRPFHLAIPVTSLEKSTEFYGRILGCKQGRVDSHWIDWDFFGHQLVTHLVDVMPSSVNPNEVDSKAVPVPHFGVVLDQQVWKELSERLIANRVSFEIEPYIRFKGKAGEQGTYFIYDPSGNALEFKYFVDLMRLFAVD